MEQTNVKSSQKYEQISQGAKFRQIKGGIYLKTNTNL